MENSEYMPSHQTNENGATGIAAKARSEAEHRVHELTEKAQQQLDAQRDRVASRIEDAASRLRARADAAGPAGHTAGDIVAVRMEKAAGYLHEHQSNEIATDFVESIRRHPLRAVFVAAVLGYLFGRLTG